MADLCAVADRIGRSVLRRLIFLDRRLGFLGSTLRHTYAALLIQTLMGHTSIEVTMDLYGYLLPVRLANGNGPPCRGRCVANHAVRRVGEALRSKGCPRHCMGHAMKFVMQRRHTFESNLAKEHAHRFDRQSAGTRFSMNSRYRGTNVRRWRTDRPPAPK
jgi:hypothetical protein